MSTARLGFVQTPTAALERRRTAVREGIASAAIEGGDVGPQAKQIMADWSAGLIDKDTMIQRVLKLDEPA